MNAQITELARRFRELKLKSEEQAEVLKQINGEWSVIETELLEAMSEEGVSSVKMEGLGNFIMSVRNMLSVNAANQPSFYQYLKESGNGALLKESVNPATLTAFLKGHLEDVIKTYIDQGMDTVDARNSALQFLNEKGATYFTKRGITLRGEK